jgi:hypothetical protein
MSPAHQAPRHIRAHTSQPHHSHLHRLLLTFRLESALRFERSAGSLP